ncbi:HMG (high mobility group) box domain-containing protein [Sarocladium implicatum]|nr:HMG (high mobility group) box domain-containing protein [Sarocladium implicatum]
MMMVSPRTLALPDPELARFHDSRHPLSASAGASPSSGWPRKRAASVDALEGDNVKPDQPWKATSRDATKNEQRDHVCLCTSDPKIPRPPFILYRISYHTKVAQDNPGLSNPEISKIIGDKWKKESEEEKERWKKLADEEKKRHQQMYPEYRYKPRRASKGQAPRKGGTSPTEETGRCPKCNGRLLTTPDTFQAGPITPKNEISDPMAAAQGNYSYDSLLVDRRRHSLQVAPAQGPGAREEESPEVKRRRLNETGEQQHPRSLTGTPTSYTPRQSGEPLSATPGLTNTPSRLPFGGGMLPQPGGIPRSQSGPIQHPSRNMSTAQWHSPSAGQRQVHNSSFQLPPLQTSTPQQPSGLGLRPAMSRQHSDSSVNTAAEVLRIPIERKLSFLAKVIRPLPQGRGGRGIVIAVEGPQAGPSVGQLGDVVEQALRTSENTNVRSWSVEDIASGGSVDQAAERALRTNAGERAYSTIPEYLRYILKWNDISTQLVRHVTAELQPAEGSVDSPVAGSALIGQSNSNMLPMPVALVKNGYAMTEADRFACNTEAPDGWTPLEHWQWAGMMWNGMPAADLSVYAYPTSGEDIDQNGSVDIQRHLNLMVVRVPRTTGQLNDATKRRVSFEVKEWMAARILHRGPE